MPAKVLSFSAGQVPKFQLNYLHINLTKQTYHCSANDFYKSCVWTPSKATLKELCYQLDALGFTEVHDAAEFRNDMM